jgi:hypothetical protein
VRDADEHAWPLTCSFGSGSLSKEIRPAALLGAALATMGPLATAAAMICLLVHALRAGPAPQHKGSSAVAAARRLERAVDFRSLVPRVQELQRRIAPTMRMRQTGALSTDHIIRCPVALLQPLRLRYVLDTQQ